MGLESTTSGDREKIDLLNTNLHKTRLLRWSYRFCYQGFISRYRVYTHRALFVEDCSQNRHIYHVHDGRENHIESRIGIARHHTRTDEEADGQHLRARISNMANKGKRSISGGCTLAGDEGRPETRHEYMAERREWDWVADDENHDLKVHRGETARFEIFSSVCY